MGSKIKGGKRNQPGKTRERDGNRKEEERWGYRELRCRGNETEEGKKNIKL